MWKRSIGQLIHQYHAEEGSLRVSHKKTLLKSYIFLVEIFYYQLMHIMLKNTELLKHSKH